MNYFKITFLFSFLILIVSCSNNRAKKESSGVSDEGSETIITLANEDKSLESAAGFHETTASVDSGLNESTGFNNSAIIKSNGGAIRGVDVAKSNIVTAGVKDSLQVYEIEFVNGGTNSNAISQKKILKQINLFFISVFILFVSIFLLHISSESWLFFNQFRKEDIIRNKVKDYADEINQHMEQVSKLHSSDSKSMHIENLNTEIKSIRVKKREIENNTDLTFQFNFTEINRKNLFTYAIVIFFSIIYFGITNLSLELYGYSFLDILNYNYEVLIFPLLVIASYFSTISLFRFILTQGSYGNYTKNKMSFFGIFVSTITLSGALITIIKFLLS